MNLSISYSSLLWIIKLLFTGCCLQIKQIRTMHSTSGLIPEPCKCNSFDYRYGLDTFIDHIIRTCTIKRLFIDC